MTVVRAGICSLPARGPARFFGGEETLVERISAAVSVVEETSVEVGIADGLFAADLAAQAGVVVPPGETPAFLAPWPLAVLGRLDLDGLLRRLGLETVGAFAALPERHVLGRLGSDGVACHRVARGLDGELAGQRLPGTAISMAALAETAPPPTTQEDFWAGRQDDLRAARALAGLQRLLGPEAVQVVRREGGRSPEAEMRFVTWSPVDTLVPAIPSRPWPGHLPSPAPALVHRQLLAVELAGAGGPVTVSARGELSAAPERLSIAGDRWTPVVAWAGPWPAWERWWRPSRRRVVHLQVVTAGPAHLLRIERGTWWLVATYD